jgi:AmmeMemoRadiSam system protein B
LVCFARIIDMNLRKSCLPRGWYPQNPGEIGRFLQEFDANANGFGSNSINICVAPHAGWFYSGKIAARAAASLDRNIDTIVVIGGHLPKGAPALFAMEDSASTPLGNMAIDAALRLGLIEKTGGQADLRPDNTVEVLLPMLRFFMPQAQLLWMRLPAALASFESGIALAGAAASLGRKIAVLASADLTHYGPDYGFAPKGTGPQALEWVKGVNDLRFIKAVESGDPAAVLAEAETGRSCCSAGAVLGAMGYATATGAGPARLIEYATSADAASPDALPATFVGYASFAWQGHGQD